MSLLKVNEIQIFNGETVTITAPAVVTANDNTNAALRITQTGTGNALVVEDSANPDSTPFVVDNAGNVGIRTSSPSSALDVNGDQSLIAATTESRNLTIGQGRSGNGYAFIDLVGDATYTDYGFRIFRNNTGPNASSSLIHRGTGDFDIAATDAGSIRLRTTNIERMRIDSSGNVGIGTSSPAQKLDVTGNINATGALTLGTALAVAEGGTGVTALSSLDAAELGSGSATDGYVLTADGAGNAAWEAASGGGGGTTAYVEHSSTISDSFTVSSGTNRMYIGGTTFSGTITVAGRLAIVAGPANFTGTINVTGTLATV